MRYRALMLPLLISFLLLPGCDSHDDDDGLACTLEARPAISVTVMIDSGETPEDGVYDVTVTDGPYSETESVVDGTASLAHERAGTYHIQVTDDQNTIWTMDDVEVTRGDCHVDTKEFTVLVEPG